MDGVINILGIIVSAIIVDNFVLRYYQCAL